MTFRLFFPLLLLFLSIRGLASADEGHGDIPANITRKHWSCKEIEELAAKYSAVKKLPEKTTLKKKELVAPLLAVMEKVLTKCELEGREAVPAEDLERE